MKRMMLKSKQIGKRLVRSESGFSTLALVLVILLIGSIVLTPLLYLVITGQKAGSARQDSMQQFYSADTGLEDAMWKIKNYEDSDWPTWMQGEWNEATYSQTPSYWEYQLPGSGSVNGDNVTVHISPTWILQGLVDYTKYANQRNVNDNVTVEGNVVATGKYEVAILKDSAVTNNVTIDSIGVWLPSGFQYVAGSSNLESASNPLPPTGCKCTPTTVSFRNGTAIIWTFSTPIDYTKLLMDESGKATAVSSGRLIDTTNNQFSASDVGRSVYNATTDKWGMVTAYNSTSNLTVDPANLFSTVNNGYEIGDTNRRVVSFSFTGPTGSMPDGAFSWVSSTGSASPSVPAYLWWTGDKLYQIVSTGLDPATGKDTSITAYTTKEQLKDFKGSMNADYEAIGNTLLMDYNVDNPYGEGDVNGSERGDGLYRDRLYASSPATLSSLPAGTNLQQVRLYWSGWKNDPWNAWPLTDAQRSALVTQSYVDRVSLKIEASGLAYETTVTADSWQVLPSGSSTFARGWNYSCYADVTAVVEAAKQYFLAHGVTFIGNAKYTVGHADASEFTTQPLEGIWGSSDSDVFLVGLSGSILHYNGTAWDLMDSGTTSNLYSVWGSASNDVFAVGAGGIILHYDGGAWTSMTSGTTNDLRSVWGSSASSVFAVGASGKILHYNGSTWSSMTSGISNTLYGVWGSSDNNVFAVGASATIRRWNGTSWSGMTSGTSGQTLYAVWGGDSTHVYAVGSKPSSGNTRIQFYNGSGSTWTAQDSGVKQDYYGVWGYDGTHVYVVGASGTIRYTSNGGSSWSAMTGGSGTTSQLNGIWGNASNSIFAVGNGGIVIGYDAVDDDGDGSYWDPMIGDNPVYQWNDSHSGESQVYETFYPLADATSNGNNGGLVVGRLDQAAYGAWSMIVIYSSPETKGHQLYLYDTFRFYWHYEDTYAITDFLAPQDVLTDPNAARVTCFVGEGDDVLTGDTIAVNGYSLSGGIPYACNPVNNVWNSKSSVAGMQNIGIDIDTFALAYPIVQPGDTSATVTMHTDDDGWCLVYMILSFRSTITTGGISSIKVGG